MSRSALTERLLSTTSYCAYAAAMTAGGFTYFALDEALGAAGLGFGGTVLAIAGAASLTAAYAGFMHLLLRGIAPLEPAARAKARPAVIAGMVTIALGSAYPNIIVSGGGVATGIEDRSYIASIATAGDALKSAVQGAEQLELIIGAGAADLDAASRLETTGTLSGSPAQGTLASAIQERAASLRAVQADLAAQRQTVDDQIARIDQASDRMRAALIEPDTGIEKRRVVMQRYGDEARSAALAIRSLVPVAPLQALADSLTGPQLEPKWSGNSEIRKNQEGGFRKVKDELKRIGKTLGQHAAELGQATKVRIPVYDPAPTSVLVVKHWAALTNIYALALALDGLPLVLYIVACALYDAARRRSVEVDAPDGETAELGAAPHPTPSKARSGALIARRNGRLGSNDETE